MSGLILPTPGLIMGGSKKIELVATSDRSQWGRSGDNPAPYTHTSPNPASGEMLVVFSGGRDGDYTGGQQSTLVQINGGGNLSFLARVRNQGKGDDILGGSVARANGPLSNPTITDRSVFEGGVDNYVHCHAVLKNAQSSSYVDGDVMTLDGSGSYSLTVNVVNGGYVLAFLYARTGTAISFTNVTPLESGADGGGQRYLMGGTQTDYNGTLTVDATPANPLGYFVVLSYGPA